ncbi:hypothetical protein THIOM_004881 [Candidatus Thiomargarita nelsonii]|uniref:Uncharacterized protein n=1 Tax=Candidatus Thiomargarita nelsonii TaxID=1003181 RepID=A0A176RUR2_9GAMM|nr:hypothetical protein THIOM_004881 [Candidatus Thiomargarita nelsonii]
MKHDSHLNKLPFVVYDSQIGQNNFWHVKPTSDYFADNALSELFAKAVLKELKQSP